MITRKLGKLLRGKTTRFEVYAATTLGMTLGFMPSFAQTPALSLLLIVLLMTLNANLFLAGLMTLIGMGLSLVLMPVSFHLGRLLLDGPLSGLFALIINAPVTALMGLSYYVVTGGLIIGVTLGLLAGWLIFRGVAQFRKKMAGLQADSERYKTWTSKPWVKTLAWLLLGGKAKASYAELAQRSKLGQPIRPLGAAAAGLLVVLVMLVAWLFSGPLVTASLIRGLERANGATVDVGEAEVNLAAGRIAISELALADPEALDTDLLRAARLEADVSASDLLRRRLSIDRLVMQDAYSGAPRATPGRRIGKPAPPTETDAPGKTLEDYFDNAKRWKRRLDQARQWLDRLGMGKKDPSEEGYRDRLKRQIAMHGYSRVQAEHLIRGAPTLLIRDFVANGLVTEDIPGLKNKTLNLRGQNLSTHPNLVEDSPRLTLQTDDGTVDIDLTTPVADRPGQLQMAWLSLPVDALAQHLRIAGTQPVEGGTYDLKMDGPFSPDDLQMPLRVTLHDSTLSLPGVKPRALNQFDLDVALAGPMAAPRLTVQRDALANALRAAGASELAKLAEGQGGKLLEKVDENLGEGAGQAIGDGLKNLLKRGEKSE
jgi:uncharacterized protein (TIGR03546 family)